MCYRRMSKQKFKVESLPLKSLFLVGLNSGLADALPLSGRAYGSEISRPYTSPASATLSIH